LWSHVGLHNKQLFENAENPNNVFVGLVDQSFETLFRFNDFKFKNNGELIGFPKFNLDEIIKLNPFNTRGCPDCNRPFYNERPTGVIYNYPFKIEYEQIEKEIVDLGLDKILFKYGILN